MALPPAFAVQVVVKSLRGSGFNISAKPCNLRVAACAPRCRGVITTRLGRRLTCSAVAQHVDELAASAVLLLGEEHPAWRKLSRTDMGVHARRARRVRF